VSDVVVVGSALVNCISENLNYSKLIVEKIGARVKDLSSVLLTM